jgi:acetate kinase
VLDGDDRVVAFHDVGGWDRRDTTALEAFVAGLDGIDAVGHRVVHGGPRHRQAAVVDQGVLADLDAAVSLAPLHQPPALAAIGAVARLLPATPAVACFDTAFHATLAPAAATYALPAEWRQRWDLRRYGFHGLSHGYAVRRAGELVGRPGDPTLRVVSCHLGSGASLCAAVGRRSVDTTMGFTPLEGLVMATRAGSVDPGLVLWLLQDGRLGLDGVATGLEERSGLAGLAGRGGDLRAVAADADAGDEAARLAVAVYDHRLRREIGAMAASAGGLDVLVFTGGVGEHQPRVRAAAAAGLAFLGVALDEGANSVASGDAPIGASGAPVTTLVVTSREDLEVARLTRAALAAV